MKIIQIIPNLLIAGAERFVVDLSNKLLKHGHEVHIILFFNTRSLQQPLIQHLDPAIRIHFLDKKLGFDPATLKKLKRLIGQIKPDIVHTHIGAFLYTAVVTLFMRGIKIVHTVHSAAEREAVNRLGLLARKFFFRKKNIFPVTISAESSNSFKKVYPGYNYTMILNGREKELPGPQHKEVKAEIERLKSNRPDCAVFLYVGRLMLPKQPQLLVKAFRNLDFSRKQAILILIGRDADQTIVDQVSDAIGESENIFYLGEKGNVSDYMAEADFFCLSSLYEGMPISLIEAFAYGLIPVSTPVGGIPEMIKDLGFLSADNQSVDTYKAVLQEALDLTEEQTVYLKQRIKKEFDDKYTMNKCASNYINLYNKIRVS